MKRKYLICCALFPLLGNLSSNTSAFAREVPAPADACDRVCLSGFAAQYFTALIAHRPSDVALAPNVRYTENGAPLAVGDGLWQTATSLGTYHFTAEDTVAGEVGAFAVITENDVPALVALRLKIASRRIAEIEILIARKGEGQNLRTDTLTDAPVELTSLIPAQNRMDRQQLVAITDSYFTAIERGDGTLVPFDDTGFRIENGVRTCNVQGEPDPAADADFARFLSMKCADQLSTKIFSYIRSIRPRRYPVVDRDKGLVMAIVRFNHPGNLRSVEVQGGGTVSYKDNPWASHPTSALIAEFFRIEHGRVTRVLAVIVKVPYRNPVGWGADVP
jgi:hypothetical protein